MIEGVLGGGSLDAAVLERVVSASEGNPLFAEQLLRMLVDERVVERVEGTWQLTDELSELNVPPTIQALLASRLDTLPSSERSVIEPASVVGYVFPEAAVAALAPPEVSARVGDRAGDPRAEAPRPSRRGRGRRRTPLPPHHDPRHRLRRHPEARPGGPPHALRRVGRPRRTTTAASSSRRSSATTSSRRGRTSPSSARWTSADARSARRAPGASPPPVDARSRAATSRPRRTARPRRGAPPA